VTLPATTAAQMSSGTVAVRFRRGNGLNRRHFFLAPDSLGGVEKRFKVRRNLGRRKLIEPMSVPCSLELPSLDRHIDDKAKDAIDQGSHDSHERDHGSAGTGPEDLEEWHCPP